MPMISLSAAIFVYLRHIVDAYNLLTYYRKEIESSGKIVDNTTNTALVIIILYQMCMIAYFALHNRQEQTIICTVIFLMCVFFVAITYEDIYDLAKIDDTMEKAGEFDDESFLKWKNEYAHPLVVGHVRRREGTAVKKVYPISRESQIDKIDLFK